MWPAVNFAADSLEIRSRRAQCGEFDVLIADGALLARRSRPPEDRLKPLGSRYRSGRSPDWLKFKNPAAPAVKREAEEEWTR